MKRNTILSALLLLAVSCVQEGHFSTPSAPETEPTVPVILSFADPVTLQAGTRAGFGTEMADTPAITSIHVAVFGSSGYLKDYISAVPCDSQGNVPGEYADKNYDNTTETTYYFKVRLPVNLEQSQRTLHIIANGPSSLPFNAYEPDVMGSMTVGGGVGAYWQRIVLPQGIWAREDDTRDEGYEVLSDLSDLEDIRLIRNFAKVVVSESARNFELVSYMLCNMPESGSVAAYSDEDDHWMTGEELMPDNDSKPGNFMDDGFITYGTGGAKRYAGFPLEPVLNTFVPASEADYEESGMAVDTYMDGEGQNPDPYKSIGYPIYVYERAVTHDTPPFILMKGKWVDNDTQDEDLDEKFGDADYTYYRLDISRDELQYFPLYRNYRYEVRITGVEVSGYDTPGEAAKHNSGDNFSISLETELLSDVANEKLHLFVQEPFIDLTYDSAIHEFWYRLLVRNNGTQSPDNGKVEISLVPGGDALAEIGEGEITGATAGAYWYRESSDRDAVDDQDNLDQERFVKYKLNNPASSGVSKLSSTLRLVAEVKENEGTQNEKTYRLAREVTIRVYNPTTEELRLVPDWIPNEKGQKTRLEIPLPLDLERSMFPLNITIWDDDKALNPTQDEQMPVSISEPKYGFDYILNWSNYQQLCQEAEYAGADHALLTCDLQTIKAISNRAAANATPEYYTTVHAECDYFKGTAVLHADSDTYLKPSWQTVKSTAAVVSVKSGDAWSLTITLEDGSAAAGASLSKSYNSQGSEEDVTVTLPPVGNHNVLYRLTLANAVQLTRTAYILQESDAITVSLLPDYTGASAKTVPCGTVGSSETYSKIVTVESGVPYYLQISEDGTTWVDASSRLDPDDPVKLRVPGNPGTTSRTLYIRARSADVDTNGNPVLLSTNEVQVTQDGATAHLRAPATIRNYESDAGVMVRSSMPVVLKAYDANDLNNLVELTVPVYDEDGSRVQVESVDASTPLSLRANSNGKDYKLRLGMNTSNADRVFQMKLYPDGNAASALVDRTIIQTASFSLSPAETEIACDATSATLTFKTEVDGTFAVSGGNTYGTVTSGVSISPDHAEFDSTHPEILQHALTLTVPENNTVGARTYTVTATNSTYTWKRIENNTIVPTTGRSESVTVTQAAGTAALTVVDNTIQMNQTTANVTVASSFPTKVRVYNGNTLVFESSGTIAASSGTTVAVTVPPFTNASGTDRVFTVVLCNADGTEFPTHAETIGTITQSGTPVFTLTPSVSNIGRDDQSATLTFTTEVDGTFAVSGGNTYGTIANDAALAADVSISPASVTTNSYGTHTLTLTVPKNNTLEDRTYTVTATNSTYHCTATATVVQAAGDAHLTVVDTEILMCQPTAQVRVDASFDTVLKVYDHTSDPGHTGTPLYTSATRTANTTATVETLSNLVNTGSARTLDVDLCNADGKVVCTGTITQQPGIRLVAAQTSVKGDGTPVTLTVISDVPWQLTSTNGGTFGPAGNTVATCTGPATDYAGQQVRWDLPANYATGTRTLTATASGTGSNSSLTDQASVTQSGSTGHVDRTTAYIYYYNNYNGLGTQSYTYSNSYTSGGRTYRYTITGELSDITDRKSVGTDRVEVSKESTFTLSASKNCRITQAKLIYYSTYGPDSITSSVGTVTSEIYYRDRWDGDVSNGNDVEFTFHKSGTDAIALNYYTVTVTVYSWD